MTDKAIINLQETVFHQGEDIERLSAELYIQQKKMAELNIQIAKLQAKLKNMEEGENIRTAEQETKPPHY
jgi:uncharacterized coiled-coil protein SlyX